MDEPEQMKWTFYHIKHRMMRDIKVIEGRMEEGVWAA